MADTVFVTPNTQLPSDIQMQVVVGQGSYLTSEEVFYKPLVIEVVFPAKVRRESTPHNNANLLELYIVNGLLNRC